MQRIVGRVLVLLSCLSTSPAGSGEVKDRPSSPAEEYQALLKEYQSTSGEFRKATTDQERKTAVERLGRFPRMFVDLAERNPKESIAVDAVVEAVRAINAVDSLTQTAWEMNSACSFVVMKDDAAGRATGLLLREHLQSDQLGPVCLRMSYGIRKEFETFLRAVLKANPHREVQALAGLALAQFLRSCANKLELVRERPEFAERYEVLFGRDYFEELKRQGGSRISREVETLLDRAAAEYRDVKHPYGGTVGEVAGAELLEIRQLAVGKEAPDIEGKDQDGRTFKLSEYRGKVVLLDFWQEL